MKHGIARRSERQQVRDAKLRIAASSPAALAFILVLAAFNPAFAPQAVGGSGPQKAPAAVQRQTAHPPPPSRPANLGSGNIGAPGASPAPPAQTPSPPPPSPFAPIPAELGPPMSLPPATRERMHSCGVEWQKMKQTGAAGDKTWRDFATVCLTR
ncbi:hypothetical protein [Methylocapsa palsarum]|uniref:hypothetical protein n=1 Tax=Methylocapsa palsarum TaxID=1612308 RepID=UPI001113A300|nr:hypothetical protein [Methylocapsa palsarum]